MNNYQILLYYKYIHLDNPEKFRDEQINLCQKLNLKGRIIVAPEGLNGTVEGLLEDTEKYIAEMNKDSRFADMNYKKSEGNGQSFPKLSVKARDEIVSLHLGEEDFSPEETTGKYLSAEEMHEWIHSGKEIYIVDMRNDYEFKVGYFKNSILPPLKNFRDLPEVLPQLEHLKEKTVITVCTGGVRCEKASGYLVRKGFKDVYQLHNGIVTYMEKYPNEDFLGKLYVFDNRVVMGFNTNSPEHTVVSTCDKCGKTSDNYVDCSYKHCKGHRHFVCCEDCYSADGRTYCSQKCEELAHKNEEIFVRL